MYCPKCGQEVVQGSNFCSQCGNALAAVDSTPAAAVLPARTNGLAIASLVLGCVGVVSGICSIPAIIFGAIALNQTGKDPGQKGRGMAIAGLVLGIVIFVFCILIITLIIVSIVVVPDTIEEYSNAVW